MTGYVLRVNYKFLVYVSRKSICASLFFYCGLEQDRGTSVNVLQLALCLETQFRRELFMFFPTFRSELNTRKINRLIALIKDASMMPQNWVALRTIFLLVVSCEAASSSVGSAKLWENIATAMQCNFGPSITLSLMLFFSASLDLISQNVRK